MANFNGTARSNYFRVKDPEAFKKWVASVPSLGLWEQPDGSFGLHSEDPDTGCWPTDYYDENDEEVVIDMATEVARHLIDGDVCVLMEAGAEKLRYVSGWAQAFDNSGQVVQVGLRNIYQMALEKFGVEPTRAEY